MDYNKIKDEILKCVGGIDNLENVSHCATRLRLTLKDDSKFDGDAVAKIDGVLNSIKVGNQRQIIIGQHAKEVAEAFGFSENAEGQGKKGFNIKNLLMDASSFMGASVGPMIIPMIGGGLVKALLLLLVQLGVMTGSEDTYAVLWFAADAIFIYRGVFIAYGAAKKMGGNIILAVYLALIMMSPVYTGYVSSGTPVSIFGINIPLLDYSNGFLQFLFTTVLMCYLERGLKKFIPDTFQQLLVPFIIVLVMTPVAFLVTGPISNTLANWLSVPLVALGNYTYILVPILGLILPLMIMFGLHAPVFMFSYVTYMAIYGYDPIFMPASQVSHIAMGAVCFAVLLKTKKLSLKETAASAGLMVSFGSISEPAIFGVLLQDKIAMLAACIGGFAGSVIAGIVGLKCYAIVGSGWTYIPTFVGPESGLVGGLVSVIVGFAVAFAIAYLLYKDKPEEE